MRDRIDSLANLKSQVVLLPTLVSLPSGGGRRADTCRAAHTLRPAARSTSWPTKPPAYA